MILLLIACPAFHPVSVVSPLNVSQFTRDLAGHPDRRAVTYVLEGLQHGFRLGFQPVRRLKPARRINHPPSRIPRSLTIIWPLRWLVVGSQAPSLRPLCPTYKFVVSGSSPKKVNPASGALLWTFRLPMGLVLMMVLIRLCPLYFYCGG